MAYYTKTDTRTTGNVFEIADNTGAYRGEELGRCTIYHLVEALFLFYKIENWYTTVNCNNQGDKQI
jgi:hypothetical protein